MTALSVMAKVEEEEELQCCLLPAEEEAAVHGLPLVEVELAEHLVVVREEHSRSAPLEAEEEGRRQESICRHRCLEEVEEEGPVRDLVEAAQKCVGLRREAERGTCGRRPREESLQVAEEEEE